MPGYPVDRWAIRCLLSTMMARSRPGWPRLGISNPWFRRESASITREIDERRLRVRSATLVGALMRHTARHPFSRMAPRKPDTQWVHFRRAQGQKSDVGAPPSRTLFALPYTGPLRSIRGGHSSGMHDLLFCCSLSASQVRAQVSAHYFHASRRFWPSVWLRVPLAPHAWYRRTPARLSFARSANRTRNTSGTHSRRSLFAIPFFQQSRNHTGVEKGFAEKKDEGLSRGELSI